MWGRFIWRISCFSLEFSNTNRVKISSWFGITLRVFAKPQKFWNNISEEESSDISKYTVYFFFLKYTTNYFILFCLYLQFVWTYLACLLFLKRNCCKFKAYCHPRTVISNNAIQLEVKLFISCFKNTAIFFFNWQLN